jgi:hypothetical protein
MTAGHKGALSVVPVWHKSPLSNHVSPTILQYKVYYTVHFFINSIVINN